MRILFDHQIMDAQARGGVSRYFYKLISTLISKDLARIHLPQICTDNRRSLPLLAESGCQRTGIRSLLVQKMRRANLAHREVERAWRRTKSRLNERASVKKLKEQDFDLFHPTYYDPYFLDHLKGKPFVLTIYDMIHEIYPEHFKPNDKTREHKALLARAATKIIAVSASTKADVLRYLNVDPGRVEVTPLANPLTGESEEVSVPESYVLYVGERNRYKNFRNLLLAFARLAAARPDLHLVCVNQKEFERNRARADKRIQTGKPLHQCASE